MTATSDVAICNLALTSLGAEPISNILEDSPNARRCNRIYEHIRDFVLTDHVWSFAQERAVLAMLAADPVWTDDLMTVKYQKPSDCLKINYVNIKSAIFKIEGEEILSNVEGLKIKYTKRVTDPMKFFPKFVEAFAARLAGEMAYAVTNSRSLGSDLLSLYYEKKLPQAVSSDSQQGTPETVLQDDILVSRISGGSELYGQTGWTTWYPVGD